VKGFTSESPRKPNTFLFEGKKGGQRKLLVTGMKGKFRLPACTGSKSRSFAAEERGKVETP